MKIRDPYSKFGQQLAEIMAHEPERPDEPWTCPTCWRRQPAGEYKCQHEDPDLGLVFSQDMAPRIRKREGRR